jgi:hypothetical protein
LIVLNHALPLDDGAAMAEFAEEFTVRGEFEQRIS